MNLWAFARSALHLSHAEFLDLTPRQYSALSDAQSVVTQQNELLFAQLTAATINYSTLHPKDPVQVDALMPSRWDAKRVTKRVNRKKVAADIRSVVSFYKALQERKGKKQ
ncbi:MAG TPA: hypothetical protein VFN53_06440 [Acidobacteriaceae bacterium]|nr:hypothetical protein [Acidobacteriaceae bacterium]